jgi:hypothetical protein
MPIQRTKGVVSASKGYAVFRMIFGLFFIGLGVSQYQRYPGQQLPYFTLGIGILFLVFGVWALVARRTLGSRLELETEAPSAKERLDEIERLKTTGLITDQEYTAKRQEILKDL